MKLPELPNRLGAGALMLLAVLMTPVAAAPLEQGSKSLREAIGRNEIVPLKSIMDWIEGHYEGQVVEVELESDAGFFGYEVDLLTTTGSKIEFKFDARSGELLSISGRDIEKAKRK